MYCGGSVTKQMFKNHNNENYDIEIFERINYALSLGILWSD